MNLLRLSIAFSYVIFASPNALASDGSFSTTADVVPACPNESDFARQVMSRTPKARWVKTSAALPHRRPAKAEEATDTADTGRRGAFRAVQIKIRALDRGFQGTLTIKSNHHGVEKRSVPGTTCNEIMGAMALIVALAIDPLASTEPIPAPEMMGKPSPRRQDAPHPGGSPPSEQIPRPQRPSPTERPPWQLGVAAEATTTIALAPNPLWGGGLAVQLSNRRDSGLPLMRFGVHVATAANEATPWGKASFGLVEARISSYPYMLSFHQEVWAGPWIWLQAGRLNAKGSDVDNPESAAIFWGAAGVGGRAHWQLSPRLFVGAQLGASFPFVRDSFYFGHEPAFHRIGIVGGTGGLDMGITFL